MKKNGKDKDEIILLREGEDLNENQVLLEKADYEISVESGMFSEAQYLLRLKARKLGCNTVLNYQVGRNYGVIELHGIPALIADKNEENLPETQKRKEAFLENLKKENLLFNSQEPHEPILRHEMGQKILCLPAEIFGIGVVILIVLVFWILS